MNTIDDRERDDFESMFGPSEHGYDDEDEEDFYDDMEKEGLSDFFGGY